MAEQTMEFKTEVSRLLDIVIHSLYSNKDIFLRELISNASDAIDKVRYVGLTDSSMYADGTDWKIKLIADKDNNTLTISDNGIGMTYDEVVENLGTIAHSGTKEFMKMLEENKGKDSADLIGQFGVGFYSAFMVADKVKVVTKKAGAKDEDAVEWQSSADGKFTISNTIKSARGTDITLYLRDDEKKYLEEWTLRELVRKYSDYIEHPVVMDIERTKYDDEGKATDEKEIKEETINSQKAIWLRDKSEITDDEYNDFYKHISHDFTNPISRLHFKIEGNQEFSALLYIPTKRPFDIIYKDYKSGPMLYVKRVQIMEHCEELLPPYLRFVKGVVESNDLPLNISREILQNNRHIEVMKKAIIKRVLEAISNLKKDRYDDFVNFSKEFGRILKEGLHYDFERKQNIAELLLFQSTKTEKDKYTSLDDYFMRMKPEQEDIYYILASNRQEAETSPYLEGLKDKDLEVLIMTDDIDDIVISSLGEYKGKKFKSVVKGDITLGDSDKEEKEKKKEEFSKLIEFIKDRLKDKVEDVRLSSRLKDSAVCLVAGEKDFDPHIEQIMKAMGENYAKGKRSMEINPNHILFIEMNKLFEKDANSEILADYTDILYDEALILEGAKPVDAGIFAKKISLLMAKAISQ